MFVEIAHLDIKPGEEAQFEKQVSKAVPYFMAAKGCHGVSLHRCVEKPNQYQLYVKWETVENHMVDFRESEGFQQWRALVGPHFDFGFPNPLHTLCSVSLVWRAGAGCAADDQGATATALAAGDC